MALVVDNFHRVYKGDDISHFFHPHPVSDIGQLALCKRAKQPRRSEAVAMISVGHKDAEHPLAHSLASHKLSETGSDDNHKMTCGTVKKSGQWQKMCCGITQR